MGRQINKANFVPILKLLSLIYFKFAYATVFEALEHAYYKPKASKPNLK